MNITIVSNPGSSSRKYAIYDNMLSLRGNLHFEILDNKVICSVKKPNCDSYFINLPSGITLPDCDNIFKDIIHNENLIKHNDTISSIGLRIVAPGSFFASDRVANDEVINRLKEVRQLAPLHIDASLDEYDSLRKNFPDTPIVFVSDSAFHLTKPNYAWNYGINIHDADLFDIKRFGYHGLSLSGVVRNLWNNGKLPSKVVVCHLGSGSSVSAIFHGRSIDTTMGFSPNEGLVMATRSGTVPADVIRALKQKLNMDDQSIDEYLNKSCGLSGLGGSDDIRELIEREKDGDHLAHLALATLVHSIQKAIGSMVATMNGCDMIVFTGTVGERSAILRKRIMAHFTHIDFILDGDKNSQNTDSSKISIISQTTKSKPIIVIPTDESYEIAKHTIKMINP